MANLRIGLELTPRLDAGPPFRDGRCMVVTTPSLSAAAIDAAGLTAAGSRITTTGNPQATPV